MRYSYPCAVGTPTPTNTPTTAPPTSTPFSTSTPTVGSPTTTPCAATPTWSVVTSPNIGSDALYDVAAASADDVWAVGNESSGGTFHPLIQHWNGTKWSIVPGPSTLTN